MEYFVFEHHTTYNIHTYVWGYDRMSKLNRWGHTEINVLREKRFF